VSLSDREVAALARRYRPALHRYLARYTGDADLADDLVQETFLRLETRPPHSDTSHRGWLFTVATNLARDERRVAKRRAELLRDAGTRLTVGDPPPDPSRLAEVEELRRQVREALATLSEKERAALLLREEGFAHREIAAAVGTTTKSVGTLIARALEKVARRLDPELGHDALDRR
jgi:RNA polymerase sigma factor (sigma-70 family)